MTLVPLPPRYETARREIKIVVTSWKRKALQPQNHMINWGGFPRPWWVTTSHPISTAIFVLPWGQALPNQIFPCKPQLDQNVPARLLSGERKRDHLRIHSKNSSYFQYLRLFGLIIIRHQLFQKIFETQGWYNFEINRAFPKLTEMKLSQPQRKPKEKAFTPREMILFVIKNWNVWYILNTRVWQRHHCRPQQWKEAILSVYKNLWTLALKL